MHPPYRYKANSAGIVSATDRIAAEDSIRGCRNFNGGFGRGLSKVYHPLHGQRRSDTLLEAGRLAAEYLVSQGLLATSVFYTESHHSTAEKRYGGLNPSKFEGGGLQVTQEGRISALARLGDFVPDYTSGKRRLPDEYNYNGTPTSSKGRKKFQSFRRHSSENLWSSSWSDKNDALINDEENAGKGANSTSTALYTQEIDYVDEQNTGKCSKSTLLNSQETDYEDEQNTGKGSKCRVLNSQEIDCEDEQNTGNGSKSAVLPSQETDLESKCENGSRSEPSSDSEKDLPLPTCTEKTDDEGETFNCNMSIIADDSNRNDSEAKPTIDLLKSCKLDIPTRVRSSIRSKILKDEPLSDSEKEKVSDGLVSPVAAESPINGRCESSSQEHFKSPEPDVSIYQSHHQSDNIDDLGPIHPKDENKSSLNDSSNDESCDLSSTIKGKLEETQTRSVEPDDENSKLAKWLTTPVLELRTDEFLKLYNLTEETYPHEANPSHQDKNQVLPSSLEICGHESEELAQIDLQDDSIENNKVSNCSEQNLQSCRNLQEGQDHYGLTFSELLTTDLSNCSSLPAEINSLQNDIAFLNGEGILGVDDPIYMSLGEIPISFLPQWEQPSQEYGKPF